MVTSAEEWTQLRERLPPAGNLPLGPGVEADMFVVTTATQPAVSSISSALSMQLELTVMPGEQVAPDTTRSCPNAWPQC